MPRAITGTPSTAPAPARARSAAIAPDGTLDRRIELPSLKLTSLMFGGPELDILYVTSMSMSGFPEDRDCDGSLFAIHGLGIRGIAEHRFGA